MASRTSSLRPELDRPDPLSRGPRPRSVPLATRFLVAFVAAAVLPLLIVGAIQSISSYFVQRGQIENLQLEAARGAANTLDAYLTRIEGELVLTARELSRQTEQVYPLILDTLLTHNTDIETLTFVDKTGQEAVKKSRHTQYGPEDLHNRADTAEFRVPTTQGRRYLSPTAFSLYGVPMVTLSIPVKDAAGEIEGVLMAEIDLRYTWPIMASMEIGGGGYAYVVDDKGLLIAHRSPTLVLQQRNLSELQGVASALQGQDVTGLYVGLEGQEVIGRYQPLQQANWFVLMETPTQQALSDVYWVIAVGAGVAAITLLLAILLGWYMARIITRPVKQLQEGTAIIGSGNLTYRISIRSRDEIGELAQDFNAMAAQLQEVIDSLEQRVAERTRGLQTAAEISRATTLVLDPNELLRQTADLVRERFNLYYVGLFLPDQDRRFAVLHAGTGEAGRQMLEQGHRIEIGGDSAVGQCIARAEARIALDVGEEAHHFDNPLLPDTRSEMALPLRSRGRVVGAMTVQSTEESAFDEASIAVMQTLVDQVGVALDHARLFAETEEALAEMEATHRRYLGRAWSEYTSARAVSGYEQIPSAARTLGDEPLPGVAQAVAEQRPVVLSDDGTETDPAGEPALVVPIVLRDQPIGALGFREAGRTWSEEDIALAQAISDQFALAADNLRLLEETQRSAARDRLVSGMTSQMRETLDVDEVLRIAVREIGETLDLHDVTIELQVGEDQTD